MSHGRSKNAEAAALAASYGVGLEQAAKALEEDAPRPAVEKTPDPAEVLPKSTVAPADSGPRKTSSELATLFFLSRDQMENELVRLELRGPADDGQTRYPLAEISHRFAGEDASRFGGIVELLANFTTDTGLAAQIVEEIIGEELERWISANGLRAEIADLKKTLMIRFKKTHSYQMARGSGDRWRELAAIQELGSALLDATAERRQKTQTQGDAHV